MLRKALFSTAAALSMFSVASVEASDRFSLGLNLGGSYPVYQPAPVIVNPYPTVVSPGYGYSQSYGYNPGYGYGSYGYVNPGIGFGYSNYNTYRPVRPYSSGPYRRGPVHHHDHHHCW